MIALIDPKILPEVANLFAGIPESEKKNQWKIFGLMSLLNRLPQDIDNHTTNELAWRLLKNGSYIFYNQLETNDQYMMINILKERLPQIIDKTPSDFNSIGTELRRAIGVAFPLIKQKLIELSLDLEEKFNAKQTSSFTPISRFMSKLDENDQAEWIKTEELRGTTQSAAMVLGIVGDRASFRKISSEWKKIDHWSTEMLEEVSGKLSFQKYNYLFETLGEEVFGSLSHRDVFDNFNGELDKFLHYLGTEERQKFDQVVWKLAPENQKEFALHLIMHHCWVDDKSYPSLFQTLQAYSLNEPCEAMGFGFFNLGRQQLNSYKQAIAWRMENYVLDEAFVIESMIKLKGLDQKINNLVHPTLKGFFAGLLNSHNRDDLIPEEWKKTMVVPEIPSGFFQDFDYSYRSFFEKTMINHAVAGARDQKPFLGQPKKM